MGFETLSNEKIFDNAIVVDNSVSMRWLFDDGSDGDRKYAQKILKIIESQAHSAIVPYLWIYESAFVVNFYATKQQLDDGECRSHLDSLMDLFSVVVAREQPSSLFDFCQTYSLSAYDSAYLLLAQQQRCPIATLDKKMKKVARKIEITIL
ncbi:MAG: type II toxin-antitoxin system VapC family toxin [Pseudomonadales bacterium]